MIALGGIEMLRDTLLVSKTDRYPIKIIAYATKLIIVLCQIDNSSVFRKHILDEKIMSCMFQNVELYTRCLEHSVLLRQTAEVLLFFLHIPVHVWIRENRTNNVKVVVRALCMHYENPELCAVFCKLLRNLVLLVPETLTVMEEFGLFSYARLALKFHTKYANASAVFLICGLLYTMVSILGSNTITSVAKTIVKMILPDLQHAMTYFPDHNNIQTLLTFTMMPILCKHANTDGISDMHAIVMFVLQCIRVHSSIHYPVDTEHHKTRILLNGFELLWNMITEDCAYIGIIRNHQGRELLEFVAQIHIPLLYMERRMGSVVSNVNMALSTSNPFPHS